MNAHLTMAVSLSFCLASSLLAQDAPRSPEMKVLSRQLGHWQTLANIRASQTDKKAATVNGESTGEWILNGRFLRMKESVSSEAGDKTYHVLMTYDSRMKTYRRWVFGSDGVTAEATGEWDQETRTMTWSMVDVPMNISITVEAQFSDDGFTEKLFGKYDGGRVIIDQSWTFTEKKD